MLFDCDLQLALVVEIRSSFKLALFSVGRTLDFCSLFWRSSIFSTPVRPVPFSFSSLWIAPCLNYNLLSWSKSSHEDFWHFGNLRSEMMSRLDHSMWQATANFCQRLGRLLNLAMNFTDSKHYYRTFEALRRMLGSLSKDYLSLCCRKSCKCRCCWAASMLAGFKPILAVILCRR